MNEIVKDPLIPNVTFTQNTGYTVHVYTQDDDFYTFEVEDLATATARAEVIMRNGVYHTPMTSGEIGAVAVDRIHILGVHDLVYECKTCSCSDTLASSSSPNTE